MSPTPTISIVLPTFDRAELVQEAIASVLAQTRDEWELIVVDDGSTDGTEAAVAELAADPRVQYRREPHGGRSKARNAGIALARGTHVGFLDSDDRYLPGALQTHLDAYASNPGAAMTIAGYEDADVASGRRQPWLEHIPLTPESWLFDCFGTPGSVIIRRDWLERVGRFAPETEPAEDWDLFLRLAFGGCPMAWAPGVVYHHRRHPGNSTLDVALQLAGAQRALERIIESAGVSPPLGRRARAWAFAVYARRAAAAGDDALARELLMAATRLRAVRIWSRHGLSLSPEGTALLLEGLVADAGPEAEPSRLAARWGVEAADVRRATARVAMREFFAAAAEGRSADARVHLRAGLRHDPRWLANRGVLSFVARRPTRPPGLSLTP